jgi:hypothetical protein
MPLHFLIKRYERTVQSSLFLSSYVKMLKGFIKLAGIKILYTRKINMCIASAL